MPPFVVPVSVPPLDVPLSVASFSVPSSAPGHRSSSQHHAPQALNNHFKYNPHVIGHSYQHGDMMAGRSSALQDVAANHLLKQQLFLVPKSPYSGRAENYRTWSSFLKTRMADVVLSPFEKLQIMSCHTSGVPHDIIQDYVEASSDDICEATVDLVWNILDERYGSESFSARYIDKRVEEFIPMKHSEQKEELGRLIDLCRLIHLKMQSNPELVKYDGAESMKKLWFKLTEKLRLRWRSYGIKFKISNGRRNPNLGVFISFLHEIYTEINDDFFSDAIVDSRYQRPVKVLHSRTATDGFQADSSEQYQTSVEELKSASTERKSSSPADCPLHDSNGHQLSSCRKFIGLPFREKKVVIWNNRLCFRCLGGHMARNCTIHCVCDNCGGNHLSILHNDREGGSVFEKSEQAEKVNSKTLCSQVCHGSEKICSKTLLVHIKHPSSDKVVTGYAILDEQSSSSFIDPSVLDLPNLTGIHHTYSLKTLSGLQSDIQGDSLSGLLVCGVKQSTWYAAPQVFTNPFIPDSRDEVAGPDLVEQHPHLIQFKQNFPELAMNASVLLLLGADSGELMRTTCHGSRFPFAHETPLGWSLVGSACLSSRSASSMKVLKTFKYSHANIFKEYMDDERVDLSQEEKSFITTMKSEIKFSNGHLVMPLPLKNENILLPDNRVPVLLRTKVAMDRLKRHPDRLKQCLISMESSISKHHIEPVPRSEIIPSEPGKCWYLPLFPVTQTKKQKTRLVFDASASFRGVCLNNHLMAGPHMTNDLRAVLLRFRKGLIGITCDIEHMFYNFYLSEDMKDYLRFYWFDNNMPDKDLIPYRARVHIFGASSSPAVASFGLQYAALNSKLPDVEEAVKFIINSFYVDDGVTSVDSVEEGVKLLISTKKLLSEFGINVHKFAASNRNVLDSLSPDDISDGLKQLDFDDSPAQRTLGVVWDIVQDSFVAKAEVPDTPFTKRGVLSAVNSYFDPIGLAAPVVLTGRLIQRKALLVKDGTDRSKIASNYDDPLPLCFRPMWDAWRHSLRNAHLLLVPRCFIPPEFGRVTRRHLHVFTDASIEAIGVIVYVVSFNERDERSVAFVTATSRVAPRAATSVPRLELCAALQGSVLAHEVLREKNFELEGVTYHTDSKVVLGYLNNLSRRFSRYVTRRVELITKVAPASMWKYVPTGENPADIATRPSDPLSLVKSCWFVGPKFLIDPKVAPSCSGDNTDVYLPEEVTAKLTLRTSVVPIQKSELTLAAERTSSWTFLVKVVSRVLFFINKISSSPVKNDSTEMLLLIAQKESFPEAFNPLDSNCIFPDSLGISNLSPFFDSRGLIRVGGRLKNAAPFDVAHPVLVPANHPITNLFVRHLHHSVGHQGRHVTHGFIRQKGYHVENGRKILRELLNNCVTCRRLRGRLSEQMMADVPSERLEVSPPFTYVGLDVFGPLSIHEGANTRRSNSSKKLFVLFLPCMVTRGVHIEPLSSMDTPSFINGLRRFFAIRGTCRRIRSDHGRNFIGALNQAPVKLDLEAVNSVAASHECEWILNPPAASHFGGIWERKIGSVKRALEGALEQTRSRVLSRDEMVTFLQEAVAIVNSTPLYSVSPDPNDASPITPNSLLTLKDNPNPPPFEVFSEEDVLQYGPKRWRRVQFLADQFWVRWRSHYFQYLSQRRKWKKPKANLKPGDVVLLRVKNSPRNRWPSGLISQVKTSADGLVRSVILKIGDKHFERAIHDLVLLIEAN